MLPLSSMLAAVDLPFLSSTIITGGLEVEEQGSGREDKKCIASLALSTF